MDIPTNIATHVPLAAYTTLRVGGTAEYFAEVTSLEVLAACVRWAKEQQLPITVFGGGSNILVSDDGVCGLVLRIMLRGRQYQPGTEETVGLVVAAGESFDAVIGETVEKGLWGLENLSAIPGTVGAVPVQNVGAYGVEVQDVIDSVTAFDTETEEVVVLPNSACNFGYRDSYFKHEGKHLIITAVTFTLSKIPRPILSYAGLREYFGERNMVKITEIRDALIAIRGAKFPDWNVVGTAGSFFKNPTVSERVLCSLQTTFPDIPNYRVSESRFKIPAAYLIDKIAHKKGFRIGDVGLFENQAIVLVNYGNASADAISLFAAQIINDVQTLTGITLEWEVQSLV